VLFLKVAHFEQNFPLVLVLVVVLETKDRFEDENENDDEDDLVAAKGRAGLLAVKRIPASPCDVLQQQEPLSRFRRRRDACRISAKCS
jgi:hypothetical protein